MSVNHLGLTHQNIIYILCDFVALDNGVITILVHIPLISPANKMQLFKHVPSPQYNVAQNYQFIIENEDQYLAVNPESTLFTSLASLENCISMRDTYLCQKSLIHKAGGIIAYSISISATKKLTKHEN